MSEEEEEDEAAETIRELRGSGRSLGLRGGGEISILLSTRMDASDTGWRVGGVTSSASASSQSSAPVRVIVTATDSVRRASRESHANCVSIENGAESAPGAVGGRYAKKPDPRTRVLNRRTSHTLLYVPEQRRTSTASGTSVASCPAVTVEDDGPLGPLVQIGGPPLSVAGGSPATNRRKSVQAGAPAIGFRPVRAFERRASQPTMHGDTLAEAARIARAGSGAAASGAPSAPDSRDSRRGCSEGPQPPRKPSRQDSAPPADEGEAAVAARAKMLSKRVSWLSMKSLQDSVEPLLGIKTNKIRRSSGQGSPTTTNTTVTMRGGDSQYGSVVQLNEADMDFDSDTPPLDTLSWSFAGTLSIFYLFITVFLIFCSHSELISH